MDQCVIGVTVIRREELERGCVKKLQVTSCGLEVKAPRADVLPCCGAAVRQTQSAQR
jgi:hypothetical protein